MTPAVKFFKKLELRLKGVPAEALKEPKSLDEIFGLSDDEEFYWALVQRGLYFHTMQGDAGNTDGERILVDIYAFRFESNAGGTLSYLSSSGGDTAYRLQDAFLAVGASE